jgi:hypothetical protein
MPNPAPTRPNRRTERSFVPLPHPTWRGDVPLADLAQPLPASEFWKRLGL